MKKRDREKEVDLGDEVLLGSGLSGRSGMGVSIRLGDLDIEFSPSHATLNSLGRFEKGREEALGIVESLVATMDGLNEPEREAVKGLVTALRGWKAPTAKARVEA